MSRASLLAINPNPGNPPNREYGPYEFVFPCDERCNNPRKLTREDAVATIRATIERTTGKMSRINLPIIVLPIPGEARAWESWWKEVEPEVYRNMPASWNRGIGYLSSDRESWRTAYGGQLPVGIGHGSKTFDYEHVYFDSYEELLDAYITLAESAARHGNPTNRERRKR